MKVVENNILPPRGYKAITLGCFIFVRKGTVLSDVDIRHESIHWEQEKELLFIGFYILYVFEFCMKFMDYENWHRAYRKISFEREAYAHEQETDYLTRRKHYAMWRKS